MKIKLVAKKKPVRLTKKPPERPGANNVIYGLLQRYERCEIEIAAIKNRYHAQVFAPLENLEAEQKETIEAIKRMTYTTDGPPPGTEGKLYIPAQGQMYRVEVMFPQAAPTYEVNRLPKELLLVEGVVTGVDKDIIDAWINEHPSYAPLVETAKSEGKWLTPRCSIKRLS